MPSIQQHRTIYKKDRSVARQQRSNKREAALRSDGTLSSYFLKHQFLPVWCCDGLEGDAMDIERAFYASLNWLEKLHGFRIRRSKNAPFPHNIARDYDMARRRLQERLPNLELLITSDASNLPFLCTAEPWDTGRTFFYIPIRPLFTHIQHPGRQAQANLLLSVLTYLYQNLRIPYYRDSNTYMWHWYQTVEEWMDQEEDELGEMDPNDVEESVTCLKEQRELLQQIYDDGDEIQHILSNQCHLLEFERRLQAFTPQTPWEHELFAVAKAAFHFYQLFPNRPLISEIPQGLFNPEINRDDRINAEQYISFWWDGENDAVTDSVCEYIQSTFQECSTIDEPAAYQCFDRPQVQVCHPDGFSTDILKLIDSICAILNTDYE